MEAKGAYEYKNNKYRQQFIHYTIHQNKKVQKLQDKYHSQFKNLVSTHNNLFKMYNKTAKGFETNSDLINLLSIYNVQNQQKYQLVEQMIPESIKLSKEVSGLEKQLLLYKTIIKDIANETQYHAMVKFLNGEFKNKHEIDDALRKNFLMLSKTQKLKLKVAYKVYLSSHKHEEQKWTIPTLKKHLSKVEVNEVSNNTLQAILNQFEVTYKTKVLKILQLEQIINETQTVVDNKIAIAHQQLEKWEQLTIEHETRYYERRARLFGSSQNKRDHYLKQASKLDLQNNGQDLLNKQINKLYEERQNSIQREGQ